MLTLSVHSIYAYTNRLDPGQLPNKSAAGLRSNLFPIQTTIPHQKQAVVLGLEKQMTLTSILENYPAFNKLS